MFSALPLLILFALPQTSLSDAQGAINVFQKACLETRGSREGFEAYSKANGGEQVRYRPRRELNQDWASGFDTRLGQLRLTHYAATGTVRIGGQARPATEQTSCGYKITAQDVGWQLITQELTAGALRLSDAEELPRSHYNGGPPDYMVRGWRLTDGSLLHAEYRPSQGTIEVSINYFAGPLQQTP